MIVLAFLLFIISCLSLIIGLIRPTIVLRWGKNRSRFRVILVYGVAIVASFAWMAHLTPESAQLASSGGTVSKTSSTADPSPNKTDSPKNDITKQGKDTPSPKPVNSVKIQMKDGYLSQPTFYEGEIDAQNQPNGSGKITYQLRDQTYTLYEGQFKNGVYDGKGTLYKLDQVEFSGVFQGGEKIFFPYDNEYYYNKGAIEFHGDTSKTKTGDIMTVYYIGGNVYYKGGWKNALPNGDGLIYHDLHTQPKAEEGHFEKGKLTGEGKRYDLKGALEAAGQYKDGDLNGKGKTFFPNGKVEAEGSFKGGKLFGKAKSYYENGKLKFEGTFDEGMIKPYGAYGDGTLYYESGKVEYKGEFKKSQYDGKGTLYNETGDSIQSGKWKDGQFVG